MITEELTDEIWRKGVKMGAGMGDSVVGTLDKNDNLVKVEVIKRKRRMKRKGS